MLVFLGLGLAGCGSGGPPPTTYVLGSAAPAVDSVEPLDNRPVVEVKPVLVPDYLDVTDILVRGAGNVVVPSTTGRWGERLSVGMTRALARSLAQRLPNVTVIATPPAERPDRQVLVEIETFEPRADGTVVLVGRWRVLDGGGQDTLAGERVSLTERITGPGDAALVAAMSRAVDAFAERIRITVGRTSASRRARR
ncbi:MAG: membrane integrity-associated transporter subunit PqiC [Gammaproteobacteria bacterium]